MSQHHESLCPVCIDLPKWQWGIFTELDDFCRTHARIRYAITIDDEADSTGTGNHHLCHACGARWEGDPNDWHFCRFGLEEEAYYGPYVQNQPPEWDNDHSAQPKYMGMRRRPH